MLTICVLLSLVPMVVDHFASAQRALQLQDFNAAQHALALAIAGEPRNTLRTIAALEASCAVLHSLDRNDEALAACDAARALASRLGVRAHSAELNRGAVLVALQRHDDAALHLAAVCSAQPKHAGARLNLGSALFGIGEFERAAAAFEVAATLAGRDGVAASHAELNRGLALENMGALDDAREAFERAAKLDRNHASARQHAATAIFARHSVVPSAQRSARAPRRSDSTLKNVDFGGALPLLGSRVFEKSHVLDRESCDWLIAAAETHGVQHGWLIEGHHDDYATVDLVAAEIDAFIPFLHRKGLIEELLEAIAVAFPRLCVAATGCVLWIRDLFVVKYESIERGGQPGLPLHLDGSQASFVLSLSSVADFNGSGTQFARSAESSSIVRSLTPPQGHALLFEGGSRGIWHGARKVTSGKRYVLSGFVGCTGTGTVRKEN